MGRTGPCIFCTCRSLDESVPISAAQQRDVSCECTPVRKGQHRVFVKAAEPGKVRGIVPNASDFVLKSVRGPYLQTCAPTRKNPKIACLDRGSLQGQVLALCAICKLSNWS